LGAQRLLFVRNPALSVSTQDLIGLMEWIVASLKALKSITAQSGKNGKKTLPMLKIVSP